MAQLGNKFLNLLDPPKDLAVDGSLRNTDHKDVLEPLLIDLFWPGYDAESNNPPLPEGFKAVGDTKAAIKSSLGSEKDSQPTEANPGKPLTEYLLNKSNKIRILRETHSTGADGRPSNLYVSQDSGPGVEKLIKNATIIITPGTILDPASKTKEDAYDYTVRSLVETHGTLVRDPYVEKINMENIITGDITMTEEADGYRIKIPTNIGGPATVANGVDGLGMINALLDKNTFKKKQIDGNDDGDFFDGNAKKNRAIFDKFGVGVSKKVLKGTAAQIEKAKNEIKKYVLVKELGDTLQVIWIKSILTDDGPYTSKNTVVVTGDTVVWYRCMLNGVPVIITYMGETNMWGAEDNEAFLIAAFKNTIREDLISDNESVISVLTEVYNFDPYVREGQSRWLWDSRWSDAAVTKAKEYLLRLISKLKNLNKDALIFIDNVPSIEGAKEAAARYRFASPFIKKIIDGREEWRTNNKVTSILPNENIKFNAKSFKNSGTIEVHLERDVFFFQIPVAGGQRGGARKNVDEKETEAREATTKAKRDTYFTQRLSEFADGDDVVLPDKYTDEWAIIETRVANAQTKRNEHIGGIAINFTEDEDAWLLYSNNIDNDVPKAHVLYLLVRDYFPEVFTYAAMMKQAFDDLKTEEYTETAIGRARYREMSAAFPNVSLELGQQFELEYTVSDQGNMLVTSIDGGDLPAEDTLTATKEAIFLANKFISYFDSIPSQQLANFLAFSVSRDYFTESVGSYTAALAPSTANNYEYALGLMEGGGNSYLESVFQLAMDNYELYYSLYVQAAYEDRAVTNAEFQRALIKNRTTMKLLEMKEKTLKTPKTPGISSNQLKRIQMKTGTPSMVSPIKQQRLVFAGGKTKYKKTQKKTKPSQKHTSRKQKRKTRRHKK